MADVAVRRLNVDVPLFLVFFAFMLGDAVFTNQVIYRTCYITLNYNESECAKLGTQNTDNITDNLEKLVQPHAAVVTMTRSFMGSCFNSVFCLFLGPWSDKFGRKPVLVSTLIGFTLGYLIIAILSMFSFLSPWFFLLASLPAVGFGGVASFLTVCFCYVTDVSSVQYRGLRMGILEGMLSAGMLLGSLTSSYLLRATSYAVVFFVCAACLFIGLLYTIFVIPESISEPRKQGYFKELFRFSHVGNMFKTVFKRRENYNRAIILIAILISTIFIFVITADSSVMFLYLRGKFYWSLRKYTLFSSISSIAGLVGAFIGIYFLNKLLRVPETVLLIMGFISLVNSSLLQGIGTKDWHIYFAGGVRCLAGIISPLIRSFISKSITEEEIGKIFAVIVTLETFCGLLASPLYTAIYNSTIYSIPELFNYLSASIYFFEIILTIVIIVLKKKSVSIEYEIHINSDAVAS